MINPGEQIGGYTIKHLLGRGGMGEVYLAQHRRVARRAAIKVLVPELSQNAMVLDRFFNEARAASLIRHPGIVEILDCDLYEGQAYIVMEYLDGESLGGYLFRTGPLERDLPFLLSAGTAVASAVGAAHATGIIHRDLKPDNIYLHLGPLDGSVAVKILDFGIAKLALQDAAPSHTSTGALLGTPTYMSPEQCRGAGRVDNRSDIYALGCILYEAVCGFPPFVRDGMGDLIVAHVSEAPVPPTEHARSLPPVVADLILRMLAKNADDRPQSMEEVVSALRACARALGIELDGPLRPRVPVERPAAEVESAPTPLAVPSPAELQSARFRAASRPVPVPEGVPAPQRSSTSSRPLRVPSKRGDGDDGSRSDPSSHDHTKRKTTTLSSTAAEAVGAAGGQPSATRRWLMVALGGLVLVAGTIVALNRPKSVEPPPATPAVRPAQPPPVPTPTPASPAAPAAPAKRSATPADTAPAPGDTPGDGETVRIDFQGVPPGTTVQVDGARVQFPVNLPRGEQLHRLVLRAPGEASRGIDLDGSRDRIVDFAAITRSPSPAARERTGDRSSDHDVGARRSGSASPSRAGAKKPADRGGSTDREAIIDL